ncbi:MAG: serine/threonine-protein kinase [Kofleriaceae bacterium]
MIGTKVGNLTIKSKLGEGGMGVVYLGEHGVIRKQCAIKVLLPEWTQNSMIVQRFTNEAIATASIKHRNIVDIIDCGQFADGAWYIVMEYLEGATLGRFCSSQGGPISMHLAIELLAQVANGLEAAHKKNIIHRDLKPENIFLVSEPGIPHLVKILDWGISKLGEREGGAVTRTGMMAGTPAYMAPEQMRDLRQVDRRTDVYALGVIAYQMITGGWLPYQKPDAPEEFANMSAPAIHLLQMTEAAVDPRRRFAGVSDGWANAILAAIHPDPARRPQTARAFALMLAEATPGDGYVESGTEIVRVFAKELLEIGNMLETVRAPKPAGKEMRSRAASRYQLEARLGEGGMAEVFRAVMSGAEGFSRIVAVKRVLPGFASVPQFASMFVDEAKIASALEHPNIVSVIDFDRDDEGRLFLVMEYVDGRDLASLASTGRLPFSATIFVVSEVLRGLGYAHHRPEPDGPRGVIHRDVSPQNVLLSWGGAVKVSDFGIAKAREASQATASTIIKGKSQYMSPEQANGEALDGRSDLFAVGIMLWELLTGQRLFSGTAKENVFQVMYRPIPRPSEVCPDVGPDLDAVVMRLLEREPSARYATAELAVEDLARCMNAPRNGRSELSRLLAERFPNAARASRPQLSAPSESGAPRPPGNVTVRDRPPGSSQPARDAGQRVVSPAPPPPPWPPGTTLGHAASQPVGPTAHRRSRWPWIIGAAGLSMGVVVTVAVVASAPVAVPRAALPASADGSVQPATTNMTTLTIISEPAGASVRLDGVERGRAPTSVQVVRGRQVGLDVSHDGYQPTTQVVTPDREAQTVTVALRPVEAQVVSHDAGVTPLDAAPGEVAAEIRTTRSKQQPKKRPAGRTRVDSKSTEPGFDPNDAVGE